MTKNTSLALRSKYFCVAQTGLQVTGQPSYDDWVAFGSVLNQVEGAVHWWIGDWVNYGEATYGEKYAEALEATPFAYSTLAHDACVAKEFGFCRRRQNLSWGHHVAVAGLAPKEQDRLLDLAEKEGLTRANLRALVRKSLPPTPIPPGKFRIIYADPPWSYSDKLIKGYGAAEHHYPAMSLEELCAMPVAGRVADDAVLFLWATSPMLEEAFQVIKAWGFTYVTSFVWDKVKHNFGHYNSVRHEFLLIATRGSCTPDADKLFDSVQTIERSARHSEKPEEFRKIIETLYTHGAKLELFARAKHKGWAVFGNQFDAATN